MSARPRHRDAIVGAATRLFRRQGFAATGLAQIVETSGAPKGSVYHYFPGGKSAIGAAAVAAAGGKVSATIAGLPAGLAPGDFIRAYGQLMAGWLRASGYRDGCPIATTVLEEAAGDEAIAMAARKAFADWTSAMSERLLAAGLTRSSARTLALMAVAALEGALILARAERSDDPILRVSQSLGEMADEMA